MATARDLVAPPSPARGEPGWLARILLVEDDVELAQALRVGLEDEYYQVTVANDGESALALLAISATDLVLLDILLPGISGMEICQAIADRNPGLPMIMITALGDVAETVRALELGASDYLVKPFGIAELKARLRAVLRRGGGEQPQSSGVEAGRVVSCGRLTLDTSDCVLRAGGRPIALPPREAAILETFLRRPGLVLTRKTIETILAGGAAGISRGTVDWHMHQLRQRLTIEIGHPLIETVYGVGWRIDAGWDG